MLKIEVADISGTNTIDSRLVGFNFNIVSYIQILLFAAGFIGLLRCMCQGSWVEERLCSIRTYKTTIFHTSKARQSD